MKLSQLVRIIRPNRHFSGDTINSVDSLRVARLALVAGYVLPPVPSSYGWCSNDLETEIPDEIAAKIAALDYAARQTEDLAEMGRQLGKINVSVPSNMNVWHHSKGESALANAANGLREAANLLASK